MKPLLAIHDITAIPNNNTMKKMQQWIFYYEKHDNPMRFEIGKGWFRSPERSAIWKRLKNIMATDGDIKRIGYTNEEEGAPLAEIAIVDRVKRDALKVYRDAGTCVLGMRLKYQGREIASQLWQGATPNYYYFGDVKRALIAELGYNEAGFYTDEGRMD